MLPGVHLAKKKDQTLYYRSGITYKGKHISLGSFPTEREASDAYREAGLLLGGETDIEHLSEQCAGWSLGFGKCVSLLNYRDNGVYIANPIYMRHNYFSYFLSPSEELKFDVDDLFYYTRHKIMKRQGHLFVNDYGMQVTILGRYGIKSHAVCPRDYEFVNGDPTDWRYSNIRVIHRYYGVTGYEHKGRRRYRVKLHINGNVTVGTYSDEERAAIAYNKAVDLAHAYGIGKDFRKNYIESLSPEEYRSGYESVAVSARYLQYLQNRKTR